MNLRKYNDNITPAKAFELENLLAQIQTIVFKLINNGYQKQNIKRYFVQPSVALNKKLPQN